jgi:hypothetical protein
LLDGRLGFELLVLVMARVARVVRVDWEEEVYLEKTKSQPRTRI